MSRNTAIAIIIFVIAALGIIGIYYLYQRRSAIVSESLPTQSPLEGFPTTQTSPPATQPQSGTNTINTNNVTIILIEPYNQMEISSPVKVSGFLNVTSSSTSLNIKDASGKILGTASAESCQDQNGCFFEKEISFQKSTTATGTVEALSSRSNDQLQSVSVKFK